MPCPVFCVLGSLLVLMFVHVWHRKIYMYVLKYLLRNLILWNLKLSGLWIMNADRENNQLVCINGLWASEMFRYNERIEILVFVAPYWRLRYLITETAEIIHIQSPDIKRNAVALTSHFKSIIFFDVKSYILVDDYKPCDRTCCFFLHEKNLRKLISMKRWHFSAQVRGIAFKKL